MVGSPENIGGDNAPTFLIAVNGTEVTEGVRRLIKSCEYESIDGAADLLKIVADDPLDENDGTRKLADSTLFAPGNELAVAFGYHGGTIEEVGRAIIRKVRPVLQQSSTPFIEIVAYTRDAEMMDNAPEPLKERKKSGGGFKNSKAGRRFKNEKYSDAVIKRAEDYGFAVDIDPTPEKPHDFFQKAGMSDYDFVKGISNITGFFFWVDYDLEDDRWVLHLKNPESYVEPQDKTYDFKYAQGDYSTINRFEPEMAIQGTVTKLQANIKDPLTGRLVEVVIEEPNNGSESPDVIDSSDGDGVNKLDKPFSTDVKLFLNEFSFDIRTNRRFKSEAELEAWVKQWFRRNRENFVMTRANVIGVESLRARQVHNFTNVGKGYEGSYVINSVRHTFTRSSGYSCDIAGRKLVGKLAQNSPVSRI